MIQSSMPQLWTPTSFPNAPSFESKNTKEETKTEKKEPVQEAPKKTVAKIEVPPPIPPFSKKKPTSGTEEWSSDDDSGYRRIPVDTFGDIDTVVASQNVHVPSALLNLPEEDGRERRNTGGKPKEREHFEHYPNPLDPSVLPEEASARLSQVFPEEMKKLTALIGESEELVARKTKVPTVHVKEPVVKEKKDTVDWETMNLKVIYKPHYTGFEETKDFPIRLNTLIAGRYEMLEYIGSAAFSRAVQCLDLQTGDLVCIKIIKNEKDFLDQSLDEIKLLKYINQDPEASQKYHVLKVLDYFYHREHLFIVTELLRDNLYEFYKYNRESGDELYFNLARLKRITTQILEALVYVHSLGLIHCDLKPENILVKSYSMCLVSVIDFGSSCFTTDHLSSYVQSRSYRAPEVILGLPYGQKIDLWSLGCIIAELYTGRVLFLNNSIQSLLARVIGIIGPFPEHMLQKGRYTSRYFTEKYTLFEKHQRGGYMAVVPKRTNLRARLKPDAGEDGDLFTSFVASLLTVDPAKRPTAEEALRHPWLSK